MLRFSLDDLRDRAFEGLPQPALEGFFIASPGAEGQNIVAGRGSPPPMGWGGVQVLGTPFRAPRMGPYPLASQPDR
jgi:hypothetical protein